MSLIKSFIAILSFSAVFSISSIDCFARDSITDVECARTGCLGMKCVNTGVTIPSGFCLSHDEKAKCYLPSAKLTRCSKQPNGQCAWQPTIQLQSCLSNAYKDDANQYVSIKCRLDACMTVCTDAHAPSIKGGCQTRPNDYICYNPVTQLTKCQPNALGKCEWVQTQQFKKCLENPAAYDLL